MLCRLVTFADRGKDPWRATVDFGDGSAPKTIEVHGGRQFLLRHRCAQPGSYTVTVTVRDDDGGVGMASFEARLAERAQPSPLDAFALCRTTRRINRTGLGEWLLP